MIVSAPMNEIELRNLMYTAQQNNNGPFTIRYPRGKGVTNNWKKEFKLINQDSYVFAESSKSEKFNYDGYEILDVKIYGSSKLTILRLSSSSSIE